jgi:uncharacterized protein YdhG (YjbR/CyaY superfamily)
MSKSYQSPEEYLATIPEDRKEQFEKLRKTINQHLPKGFEECIQYNMLGWVVPYSIYPSGYHCKPQTPLPFINLANQKGYIALYHMGVYAREDLLNWFQEAYPQHAKYKLDMGKSCIRFKRMDDIPYELIAELVSKMSPQDWISLYEKNLKR